MSSINTINVGGIDKEIEDTVAREDSSTAVNKVTRLEAEVEGLSTRVDNIAHLPSGSTTGDAELMDIRVGYNNETYENAGTAVREQISDVYQNIDDFSEMLDVIGLWIRKGTYLNTNGTISYSIGRMASQYILCEEGDTVYYMGETNHPNVSALVFYDDNKNVLSKMINVGPLDTEYSVTVPNGAVWMRVSGTQGHRMYARGSNTSIITRAITNLQKNRTVGSHIFIPGIREYFLNIDRSNEKITFYGDNRFIFNNNVVDVPNGTELSYSGLTRNLIYILFNGSNYRCDIKPENNDFIIGAFFKNYLDVDTANTFTNKYAVDGSIISKSKTIEITEDSTERLLIKDISADLIIEGNNHTIDLGEHLTGQKNGNITVIPYTASENSYFKRVFVDRTVSIDPIRQGVYYAVLVAIKNGIYTRLTPYYTTGEVNENPNSFTYSGATIVVNCSDYDDLVAIQNPLSCLDIRKGVKAVIKNLTLKHSFAGNVVAVEGSDVEFINVNSICSGAFDGFRCDYGSSKFNDCKAMYNGKDGFNFNNKNQSYICNCEGSNNLDDGISHHEQGTTYEIESSIFNNNAKGGISSPVLGAEGVAKNCICKNNHYGVYTYQSKKAILSGIVTKDNTNRILNSNPAYMINCVSINDGSDVSTSTLEEYSN